MPESAMEPTGFSDETQIDLAMKVASEHRLKASELRQMGFIGLAKFYLDNAKKAERWACSKDARNA